MASPPVQEPKAAPVSSALHDLLHNTLIQSQFKFDPTQIVLVYDSDTIADVLAALTKANVVAAPVFSRSKQAYVGFIDSMDLVATLHEKSPDVLDLLSSSGDALASRSMQFLMTPVSEVLGAGSKRNRLYAVPRSASLSYALLVVSEKVKRVAIVDEANHIGFIFTQTNALQLLASNVDRFPAERASMTAADIVRWAGSKPVIAAKRLWPVVKAMFLIREKNITAVPVLHDDGTVLGVVGVNDLKRVYGTFFKTIRHRLDAFMDEAKVPPPYLVAPCTPLVELVQNMAARHAHLAVVVDEGKHALGVVSMTDVLQLAASF